MREERNEVRTRWQVVARPGCQCEQRRGREAAVCCCVLLCAAVSRDGWEELISIKRLLGQDMRVEGVRDEIWRCEHV